MDDKEKQLLRLRLIISRLDAAILVLLAANNNPEFKEGEQKSMAALLELRNEVVILLGKIKTELGLPIYCPQKEGEKLKRLKTVANLLDLSISDQEIDEFFRAVFKKSRQIQEQQRETDQRPQTAN